MTTSGKKFRSLPRALFLFVLVIAAVLAGPRPATALFFGKSVDVTLEHPPELDLIVETVAFAPPRGDCADELADIVIEDFVQNGVGVTERGRIDEILDEIDLSASGIVQAKDAVSLGQILGADSLIFVEAQRCAHEKNRSRKAYKSDKGTTYQYFATTQAFFKGSLRIVDLANGRVLSSKTVDKTREQSASSSDGYPEYPSEYELHDLAIRAAATDVHRLFFPWTETLSLRYFNGKKCGMDDAFERARIRDVDGALATARKGLEACRNDRKVKPKHLARAHYNVGMGYLLKGRHAEALEHFDKAHGLDSGSRIRETIETCQKARRLATAMARYEDRLARHEAGEARVAKLENSDAEVEEGLEALEKLREQGLLSDEEFAEKKAKLKSHSTRVTEGLEALEKLHAQGLLSDEEFKQKKGELLGSLR